MAERNYWFNAPEMEAHKRLIGCTNTLRENAAQRWAQWHEYEVTYQDRYWHNIQRPQTARPKRYAVNRSRLLIETYKSKLLKTRVLPMALVKDGDYDLKLRARWHNLFMEGAFEQLGIYDQDPLWADDCCMTGTYFAHTYLEDGQPVCERVDPFEVLLDEIDWQYRNGRSIHRDRCFDRQVAMELWPDASEALENAPSIPPESWLLRDQDNVMVDQILVTYSWHRRSGPKAKDGRCVVWVPGATLEEEYEAELDALPFAWGWNSLPRRGMWGHPLMADLYGPQQTHDRWTGRIDQAMWLMAVPKIILKGAASKISAEKITNGVADILRIVGAGGIETWNSDGISPQAFQFVKWVEDAMQVMGRTSLLSTEGEVPKNIRAYQALKLLEDTDQEGLREPMRFRDSFFVQIAKNLAELFNEVGGFELLIKNKHMAKALRYSDVKLKENQYRWAVMPTAFFAKTAAARVDQINDLVEKKLIPPDRAAGFLDIPDLESETADIMAQSDAIQMRISRILNEGEAGYMEPHSLLDLALLRTMVGNAVARAEADGAPEAKIDLLIRLATDAEQQQKDAAAADAPPGTGMAPAAPGPTGAPNAPPPVGLPGQAISASLNGGS